MSHTPVDPAGADLGLVTGAPDHPPAGKFYTRAEALRLALAVGGGLVVGGTAVAFRDRSPGMESQLREQLVPMRAFARQAVARLAAHDPTVVDVLNPNAILESLPEGTRPGRLSRLNIASARQAVADMIERSPGQGPTPGDLLLARAAIGPPESVRYETYDDEKPRVTQAAFPLGLRRLVEPGNPPEKWVYVVADGTEGRTPGRLMLASAPAALYELADSIAAGARGQAPPAVPSPTRTPGPPLPTPSVPPQRTARPSGSITGP